MKGNKQIHGKNTQGLMIMKKLNFFLIVIFLSLMTAVNAQTNWKTYNYTVQNFVIDFCQEPALSKDTIGFNDSVLIESLWEVEVADSTHENAYYSVSYVTYPPEFIHSDSAIDVVVGFLNSTMNTLLEDETISLLSSSLVEKQGFPGKVFKWKDNSSGVFFEFHVFLVENNVIQLSVVTRDGQAYNKMISKYIDSFTVINIPNGKFIVPDITNERTLVIEFPEKPTDDTKTVDSEYGVLSLDIQVCEPKEKDDNMVYVAMETRYDNVIIDVKDPVALNGFYKKSIEGSLKAVNGDLISISDIAFKGNPGKEYRSYLSEGKAMMIYRVFLIDNRMYTFGVITGPDKDKNKGMSRFFDSFKIKK